MWGSQQGTLSAPVLAIPCWSKIVKVDKSIVKLQSDRSWPAGRCHRQFGHISVNSLSYRAPFSCSASCRVAPAMRWSTQDWTSINGNPHHTIGYQLSSESRMQVYEGWFPSYELRGPRFWELTISMTECKGLAFVTLAKIDKWLK